MEEAVSNARYFCHACNSEIDQISIDFKCPNCLDGFIEELPTESEASSATNVGSDPDHQVLRFASEIFNNPLLTPILMTSGVRGGAEGEGSSDGGIRGIRRREFGMPSNFDTILQDIILQVGGVEAPSLFFTGNPGDYAWGREGLDTIVTQLLNQMDNTGPPPLEKEKIAEIPKVKVEQEQVDAKVQCSVCWEDFQLDEPVRKLPCGHIYHENCICPWLEFHGTCPICRMLLVQEGASDQQRSSLSAAAQAVANTIRNAMRPGSSSSSDTASTSATSATNFNASQHDINSPSSTTDSRSGLFSPSNFVSPNTTPFLPNSGSNSTSNTTSTSSANGVISNPSHPETTRDMVDDLDFD